MECRRWLKKRSVKRNCFTLANGKTTPAMVCSVNYDYIILSALLISIRWMVDSLDSEAKRLGISRQAVIKFWIAEKLDDYHA